MSENLEAGARCVVAFMGLWGEWCGALERLCGSGSMTSSCFKLTSELDKVLSQIAVVCADDKWNSVIEISHAPASIRFLSSNLRIA